METNLYFEKFIENESYYKGLLRTPAGVMCRFYSKEKKEILPPRYAAIDNDPVESKCFFIKDHARPLKVVDSND